MLPNEIFSLIAAWSRQTQSTEWSKTYQPRTRRINTQACIFSKRVRTSFGRGFKANYRKCLFLLCFTRCIKFLLLFQNQPTEGEDQSDIRFRHITEITILTVQLIVEFAKRLPGFDKLLREDQIALLKVSITTLRLCDVTASWPSLHLGYVTSEHFEFSLNWGYVISQHLDVVS